MLPFKMSANLIWLCGLCYSSGNLLFQQQQHFAWWFRLSLLCVLCFTPFPSLAPDQDLVALVSSGPTYVSYHFHTAAYYALISFIMPRLHKAKKWNLDLSFALGEVFSCQNAAIWHLLCLVAIRNRGHILESEVFFWLRHQQADLILPDYSNEGSPKKICTASLYVTLNHGVGHTELTAASFL